MSTKQDISNYVSFQPLPAEVGLIFYLTADVKTVNNIELNNSAVLKTILKAVVECTLTEEEMIEQVDALLMSFEPYIVGSAIDRAAIEDEVSFKIEPKCRLGIGNTKYKNSIYYKGDSVTDSAIIVAEFNDKYAVFKHPNFDTYGFVTTQ